MPAHLPAVLLSGLPPNRGGLCQEQEPPSQGRSQDQRGIGRSDRRGTIHGYHSGRSGLLRACRIPYYGSTSVKRAVRTSPKRRSRKVAELGAQNNHCARSFCRIFGCRYVAPLSGSWSPLGPILWRSVGYAVARACYELGRKSHRNADFAVGLVPSRSLFSAFLSRF